MSVVFLNKGPPQVTMDQLRRIAAQHHIEIPQADEEDYRHLLDGFDATVKQVEALPTYEEPKLKPIATESTREYWKADSNPLNAWSHRVRQCVIVQHSENVLTQFKW